MVRSSGWRHASHSVTRKIAHSAVSEAGLLVPSSHLLLGSQGETERRRPVLVVVMVPRVLRRCLLLGAS